MNAKEARETARAVNTNRTTGRLAAVMLEIEKAVKKGEYSVWFYERLTPDAISTLQADGFKVREQDDQRDGYMAEISWR